MKTTIKTVRGLDTIETTAVIHGKRILYLTDPITEATAIGFAREITYFAIQDSSKPVKLFVDSPGGELFAGMMMYDIIRSDAVPVEMYCLGMAASMSAILFTSGRHGRYMLPHAKLMIHEPRIYDGVTGKGSSLRALSDHLMKSKEDMDRILAEHTGRSVEKIAELTSSDYFMDAKEAVELGFADRVMEFDEMLGETGRS